MLEIVQDILEAERKAEDTLKKAKEEAAKIRAEAEGKANKILADARNEARLSSQDRLEQARRQSSEETERRLIEERKKIDIFEEEHSTEIGALVSDIAKLIIQTDRQD